MIKTKAACSTHSVDATSKPAASRWFAWSRPLPFEWILLVCIVLAVGFRIMALDHLPGINGDEAYNGTKAVMTMRGEEISLRTGRGLPPDPLSLGLSCIVHALFGISFRSLRLPAVIWGILTIVVVFLAARRIWGPGVALTCAALASALPTHIVYSRFFWEPSQSPLVCALWLYAALTRRLWLVLALGCLAVIVHPSNMFLLPIVAGPFLDFKEIDARLKMASRMRRLAMKVGVPVCLGAGLILALLLYGIRAHICTLASWGEFASKYPGLMDGSTVYQYIIGPLSATTHTLHRLGFVLFWVVPVALSLYLGDRKLRIQVASLLAALVIFLAIAGPGAVSPTLERYALWMTVPHILVGALAWETIAQRLRRPWVAHATAIVVCGAFLASFSVQYFHRLHVSNSVTENAFATAEVEPKQQAFAIIEKHTPPGGNPRILADVWSTYWALKYLSLGSRKAHYEVTMLNGRWDIRFPRDFTLSDKPIESPDVFLVGYVGGSLDSTVRDRWPNLKREVVKGYGGRPVLAVLGVDLDTR